MRCGADSGACDVQGECKENDLMHIVHPWHSLLQQLSTLYPQPSQLLFYPWGRSTACTAQLSFSTAYTAQLSSAEHAQLSATRYSKSCELLFCCGSASGLLSISIYIYIYMGTTWHTSWCPVHISSLPSQGSVPQVLYDQASFCCCVAASLMTCVTRCNLTFQSILVCAAGVCTAS